MICNSCGCKFGEMEQTNSEYKNGQCPSCGSDDTTDEESELQGIDNLPYLMI